jgi:hypothetical protein
VEGAARVVRAAIFKNGFGFVFRRVHVRAGTVVRIDGAPQAVLGTLWAYATEGDVSVRSFRAVEGKGREDADCDSVPALLRAHVGKRVRLSRRVEGGGSETMEGTVDRSLGGNLFLLRTGEPAPGRTAFSADAWEVTFVDDPATACFEEIDRTQLLIEVGGRGEGTIEYTALESGLKWVPEYRVQRTSSNRARISLQGTLVNDAADLADAEIDLMVGVPHYLMSGTLSPMVIRGALERVGAAAAATPAGGWARREDFSNAIQTQMVVSYEGNDTLQGGASVEMAGSEAGDAGELHLYHIEHVSLGKGERSIVPILSAEVPVEDVYKWTVNGSMANALSWLDRAGQGDGWAIERVAEQRVWHHLRMRNGTELPWTTGPAVIFDGDRVVAQDLITYTPAGASTDLRVTMAADVLVEWNDVETDRDRSALRRNSTMYDRIRGTGELVIRSRKTDPITVVVVRRMLGEIVDPDRGGTVRTEPGGGGSWSPGLAFSRSRDYAFVYDDWARAQVNSPSSCEWRIEVRPGRDERLGYGFRYYAQ